MGSFPETCNDPLFLAYGFAQHFGLIFPMGVKTLSSSNFGSVKTYQEGKRWPASKLSGVLQGEK